MFLQNKEKNILKYIPKIKKIERLFVFSGTFIYFINQTRFGNQLVRSSGIWHKL